MGMHRLTDLFERLANDVYPARDGAVEVLESPPGKADAVVAFTEHLVVASSVDAVDVQAQLSRTPDPMSVEFLTWLGGQLASIPSHTRVVLVAKGTGEGSPILVRRDDLTGFLKVAQHMVDRDDVEVYSDQYGQSILVMGSGLAGRRELAVQVVASQRRAGTGRRLVRSAIALTPQGVPLFAQVGAGNAASLRAFYNAGFRPVGAEVLFPKT